MYRYIFHTLEYMGTKNGKLTRTNFCWTSCLRFANLGVIRQRNQPGRTKIRWNASNVEGSHFPRTEMRWIELGDGWRWCLPNSSGTFHHFCNVNKWMRMNNKKTNDVCRLVFGSRNNKHPTLREYPSIWTQRGLMNPDISWYPDQTNTKT